MFAMEEMSEEMEEQADKPRSAAHNIGDMVYVDNGRGWWFHFRPGTRYQDGKFILKTNESTIEEDSSSPQRNLMTIKKIMETSQLLTSRFASIKRTTNTS